MKNLKFIPIALCFLVSAMFISCSNPKETYNLNLTNPSVFSDCTWWELYNRGDSPLAEASIILNGEYTDSYIYYISAHDYEVINTKDFKNKKGETFDENHETLHKIEVKTKTGYFIQTFD